MFPSPLPSGHAPQLAATGPLVGLGSCPLTGLPAQEGLAAVFVIVPQTRPSRHAY